MNTILAPLLKKLIVVFIGDTLIYRKTWGKTFATHQASIPICSAA
jgi:hypothetical protein